LVCMASDLTITTQTDGAQLDQNGYTVIVNDGAFSQAIGVNSSSVFSELQPGSQTVEITGVAPNCTVSGGNPRSIELEVGGTEVVFPVNCTAGGLVVEVSTQGDPEVSTYTVTVDGSESQTISKDGTVQFASLSTEDHQVALENVPEKCAVLGENPRTVAVPGSITFQVDCNPLSGTIFFTRQEAGSPTPSIYAMNDDGTGSREIVANASGGSISRDGTRMAYVKQVRPYPDRHNELWVASTDGSGTQKIFETSEPMTIGQDAWSPDGTRLVLRLNTGGTEPFFDRWNPSIYSVVIMSVETADYSVIPGSWGNCSGGAWSPDGGLIAMDCWAVNPTDPFVGGCPACKDARLLVVAPPEGGSLRALTDGSFAATTPTWSPNSEQLVFVASCECETNGQILTVEEATFFTRSIGAALGFTGSSPTWSPDGLKIAISRADSWTGPVTNEIFVINVDSTNPVNLSRTSGASETMPRWVR
jgi:hypothetical protein